MSHFKSEYRQAALSTDWKRNVGVVWVRYKATKSIIQSVPRWSLWSKAVGTPLVSNHQVWSIYSLWLRQTFQGYLTSERTIPYQVYLLVLPYKHSVKKKATTHNLPCELYGSNGQRYRMYTLRLKQSSEGMAKWVRGHQVLCIHITARLTNPGGYLRVPPSNTKERENRNIFAYSTGGLRLIKVHDIKYFRPRKIRFKRFQICPGQNWGTSGYIKLIFTTSKMVRCTSKSNVAGK